MDTPKISVVLGAVAKAIPIGSAKEPPQRDVKPLVALAFSAAANSSLSRRERPFVYDWEDRLKAVNPDTHPLMQFNNYQLYKDRLFQALKILNATDAVNTAQAGDAVMAAFSRLREASRNQNALNRNVNLGRTEYQMDGHDMEALMEVAVATPRGTMLRERLEQEWLHGTLFRDTERHARQLRGDLAQGLNLSIPGSAEASLYETAIASLADKDRRTRLSQSGLKLVR